MCEDLVVEYKNVMKKPLVDHEIIFLSSLHKKTVQFIKC